MLQPARRKYRKEQKGRNTGLATRGASVSFGDFGLKAVGRGQAADRDHLRHPHDRELNDEYERTARQGRRRTEAGT